MSWRAQYHRGRRLEGWSWLESCPAKFEKWEGREGLGRNLYNDGALEARTAKNQYRKLETNIPRKGI